MDRSYRRMLAEGTRTMEGSILRKGEGVTEGKSLVIIGRFRKHMERMGLSQAEAARHMRIAESTLSQLLAGEYKGNTDKLIRRMDRINEEWTRQELTPDRPAFVETGVAMEIYAACTGTRDTRAIGVIYGPPRIGKTLALRAWVAEQAAAIYLSVIEGDGSHWRTVKRLVDALVDERLVPRAEAEAARTYGARIDLLLTHLAGRTVSIVIDEADFLTPSGVNALRHIHDNCDCPLVMAGTKDLYDLVERWRKRGGGKQAQNLGRLFVCYNLEDTDQIDGHGRRQLFTVEDVRKIFAGQQVRLSRDGERWMLNLANTLDLGSLGACIYTWIAALKLRETPNPSRQLAQILAAANGEITAALLYQASQMTTNGAEGLLRHDLMGEEAHRLAATA